MKKNVKVILIILLFILFIIVIYNNINLKKSNTIATRKILYTKKNESDIDTIWCGTFQLAWNELKKYIDCEIEFENESPYLLQKMNQSNFSKDMINEKDYYIKVSKINPNLKSDIYKDLNKKFKIKNTNLLENIDYSNSNGVFIYSILKKEFNFLEEFDNLNQHIFTDINNEESKVNFFGISAESKESLIKNIEILYYKDYYSFILKLKTKENEDIILYKTENLTARSFDELYNDIVKFSAEYNGKRELAKNDIFSMPNIILKLTLNYEELCNKEIKNADGEYISNAIQDIDFILSATGGKISSEANITTDRLSAAPATAEYYELNSPFVIFIKESDKEKPYFALKILNTTFLET